MRGIAVEMIELSIEFSSWQSIKQSVTTTSRRRGRGRGAALALNRLSLTDPEYICPRKHHIKEEGHVKQALRKVLSLAVVALFLTAACSATSAPGTGQANVVGGT